MKKITLENTQILKILKLFEIVTYNEGFKKQWDEFISVSKNGTFLFYRDYMDYHSDRFIDCSFLFFKKGKLYAVLPANVKDNTLYSHQGLTYGGIITSNKTSTRDVLNFFTRLDKELYDRGIRKVVYKPVPYIYHRLPAQEDIYALFKRNANKIGCNISSAVYQNKKIKFNESRRSGIRKAQNMNLTICASENFQQFIQLLNKNLQNKYGTNAVHSLNEIINLHSIFPENIKLYTAEKSNKILAGTIIYIMTNIIHVQYISADDEGKKIGAIDLLFDELINNIYLNIPIFDFGQSTEQMGNYLNKNLIFQKEGFGGRGVCYDIYEYYIKS